MEVINVGGEFSLKLSSKKLKSGKHQVKFHASGKMNKKLYGYVLADVGETVTDVVNKIVLRLEQVRTKTDYHHINLYSIGKQTTNDTNFMMFDA